MTKPDLNILEELKKSQYSGQKILVVDDDDVSFFLVKEILSAFPFEITRAYNGREATEIVRNQKNPFDLIIMDIRMPEMNGYEATRKIKEIYPSLPIIALTAYAHYQGKVECISAGCDAFIAKPFDINYLLTTIEDQIN